MIIKTHCECDLAAITQAHAQAVIYLPRSTPDWLVDLTTSVENGAFQVPRITLPCASRDQIDNCLAMGLPEFPSPEARTALLTDVLALVDRLSELSGCARFMLRIFTGTPSTECGFHVDTVPPGAPALGLLRVYNGAGTSYIDPDNVTSMAEFYRYMARRERMARERATARADGADTAGLEREINALDEDPPFLIHRKEIGVVPAGSIVAFKHLDISYHWSNHPTSMAWIHCSPMSGKPRLVVNLSAADRHALRVRRSIGNRALQ
jgi:hypothetical protein